MKMKMAFSCCYSSLGELSSQNLKLSTLNDNLPCLYFLITEAHGGMGLQAADMMSIIMCTLPLTTESLPL